MPISTNQKRQLKVSGLFSKGVRFILRRRSENKPDTFIAILWLLALLVSCSSIVEIDYFEFEHKVSRVNQLLEYDEFQPTAKSIFEIAGPCKVIFRSYWSDEISRQKGFGAVQTSVLLDLKHQIDAIAIIPAHVVTFENSSQVWRTMIRLDLSSDIQGLFATRAVGETEYSERSYSVDLVSIGISDPDELDNAEILVGLLVDLVEGCGGVVQAHRLDLTGT